MDEDYSIKSFKIDGLKYTVQAYNNSKDRDKKQFEFPSVFDEAALLAAKRNLQKFIQDKDKRIS